MINGPKISLQTSDTLTLAGEREKYPVPISSILCSSTESIKYTIISLLIYTVHPGKMDRTSHMAAEPPLSQCPEPIAIVGMGMNPAEF
jgi:hypothetical protein